MDKKAFDRARAEIAKKTADLSEEEAASRIRELVEETRSSPPPTLRLLGVTYPTSSEATVSSASLTLTSSSGV
jgi:hypothetical protein